MSAAVPPAPAAATARQHRGLAVLLAGLSALGPFATDAYLPSLREIGHEFAAAPVVVQQTLTAFLVFEMLHRRGARGRG